MQRRWPTCPGITPRWAGCHPHAYRITISRTTHPRVGGENSGDWWTIPIGRVSSPRGRGKRAPTKPPPRPTRLIPARAGKTHRGPRRGHCGKAHPRAGGENLTVHFSAANVCGSSPRGRGKPIADRNRRTCRRLIPAWAGKTAPVPVGNGWPWAHPRVGGENGGPWLVRPGFPGSSPRGRGKRKCFLHVLYACGLIPAWAGKTADTGDGKAANPAHPRVGGENSLEGGLRCRTVGSSPRGRGKPISAGLGWSVRRLIPAWAGKTFTFT